jgi:hypothetical protein
MDVNDRLIRLDNALIDVVIVMTEGNLSRLDAYMAPDVVAAGTRFQAFHRAVINERSF